MDDMISLVISVGVLAIISIVDFGVTVFTLTKPLSAGIEP